MNFVSFYDSLRFANWLRNGQGSGDTETGAYTLLGGTATPRNGPVALAASVRGGIVPSDEVGYVGSRVASLPEPGTGLLLLTGVLGLAGWRRRRG